MQDEELLAACGQPEEWDAFWQKAVRRAYDLEVRGHHQPFESINGAAVIHDASAAFEAWNLAKKCLERPGLAGHGADLGLPSRSGASKRPFRVGKEM